MNFLFPNSTNGFRPSARSGLSIIEVLTSVVVAMIGVFGVLALIPFAVKQASIGLDSDAAVVTARNAISQMEITGMQIPQNWTLDGTTPYSPFGTAGSGAAVLSLDPLGVTEVANLAPGITVPTAAEYFGARFPFEMRDIFVDDTMDPDKPFPNSADFTDPTNLALQAASFLDPTVTQFDSELARRMCRAANDLVFAEAVTPAGGVPGGPEQIFDTGTGGSQRRQFQGRISWSAIVVPFTSDPTATSIERWSYRMYILVYKDRDFNGILLDANGDFLLDTDGNVVDPGGSMTVARLGLTGTGTRSPIGAVDFDMFDDPADDVILTGSIKRDDWVMLINRNLNPSVAPGFDKQLGFYRVVNFADEPEGSSTTPASITLDGPDFDFGGFGSRRSDTYIVHLRDVVGVYERTFTPELESLWNISD